MQVKSTLANVLSALLLITSVGVSQVGQASPAQPSFIAQGASAFPLRFNAHVLPNNTARARVLIDGNPVIVVGPPFLDNNLTPTIVSWATLNFGVITKGLHRIQVEFLADPSGDQRLTVDVFPTGTNPSELKNASPALSATANAAQGVAGVWAGALDFWVDVK